MLGHYRVLDSLGQGGMGQVFRAEHSVMGRVVAIKVLPRHKATPEAIACFQREVRVQALLDHANLVRAYDAGYDGNVYYLVTEYVPGCDLRRLVHRQGPLGAHSAAAVIAQAAAGLQYAHEQGIVHRDIKPGNLLVSPTGITKVSDLGLVEFSSSADARDPKSNRIVGTADYLAPEQVTEAGAITPAVDIYALGCTLYYAVTGKVPYPGGGVRDKARAHCKLNPIDPRRLNHGVSEQLCEVIGDMMAKRPEDRPADCSEVIKRLRPWLPAGWQPGTQLLRTIAVPPPPPAGDAPPFPLGVTATTDIQHLEHSPTPRRSGDSTHPLAGSLEDTIPDWEIRQPWSWDRNIMGLPLASFIAVTIGLMSFATLVAVLALG